MFLVPLAVLTTWPTRPTCLDVATSAETCAALAMWGCEGDLAAPVRANCCVCGGGVFGLLLPWDVSLRSELGASSGEGIDAPPGGAVHLRVPALMDVWRVRGPCPPTFSRLADGGDGRKHAHGASSSATMPEHHAMPRLIQSRGKSAASDPGLIFRESSRVVSEQQVAHCAAPAPRGGRTDPPAARCSRASRTP